MLSVSELYIYPIKSLGGISLKSAVLSDRGFEYDRRWMLVDKENRFLTQRELPSMALLQVGLSETGLSVQHKTFPHPPLFIPFQPEGETVIAEVWEDRCRGQWVSIQ